MAAPREHPHDRAVTTAGRLIGVGMMIAGLWLYTQLGERVAGALVGGMGAWAALPSIRPWLSWVVDQIPGLPDRPAELTLEGRDES